MNGRCVGTGKSQSVSKSLSIICKLIDLGHCASMAIRNTGRELRLSSELWWLNGCGRWRERNYVRGNLGHIYDKATWKPLK
jgi:hypothetical protein